MRKDDILRLLKEADRPLSGEAMSHTLAVSRAAVWKAVEALREEGYVVDSLPGRGYRLMASPDVLSPGELIRPDGRVGNQVICLERVDSTNDEAKRRAASGAPGGLAVIAGEQTGGKGRRGRSFQSLPGKGLYLTTLLRPPVTPAEVSQITAWTAVAVCRAVEALTGLQCGIKWTNDILLDGKKLCGILTELGMEGESGALDYVAVGIGVNISQTAEDFGAELADIATSLGQYLEHPPRRAEVAAALLAELDRLCADFPEKKESWLEEYRRRCLTVGREVRILQPGSALRATALGVEDDFSLRVRRPDGREEIISAGEVSVRGLLGYV